MKFARSLLFACTAVLPGLTRAAQVVNGAILVIGASETDAKNAATNLRGYGIPYDTLVASSGTDIPPLTDDDEVGKYAGIVVAGDILSEDQYEPIYQYQEATGARLVRWDASPDGDFGTTWAEDGAGCCDGSAEQNIWISDASDFPTAGLRVGAKLSTVEQWHQPAKITNATLAKQIATFGTASGFRAESAAGVVNDFGKRKQMVWFLPLEHDWSYTANVLSHAWITWLTRGVYTGYRRAQLNTQVDDMHLITDIYSPKGEFRLRAADLDATKEWLPTLNAQLNSGSVYYPEIGHNGNGNIEASTEKSERSCGTGGIEYVRTPDETASNLEFKKPTGTGTDCWPRAPVTFTWSDECIEQDALEQWFANLDNANAFAHLSHTFTHESLNNATYADVVREIQFNQVWFNRTGLAGADKFGPTALIPPAITGLHNGDALRAWTENGIKTAVGDNTRPVLLNPDNEYHPLITTDADNGFEGFPIIPRWATNIYYNCDTPSCVQAQYKAVTGTTATFAAILAQELEMGGRQLMQLRHDPYMFHQANMRQTDVPATNGRRLSLLMTWVELIATEFTRVVDWPLITVPHETFAQDFLDRAARDACRPALRYNLDEAGAGIVSVTLSADACAVAIPLTFPAGAVSETPAGATAEQTGADPLTLWVGHDGADVTVDSAEAIPWY